MIFSIILGKGTKKTENNTHMVCWSIKGGDFNTSFTTKIEIVSPGLYVTKGVMCNFHVDDLQVHCRYDMILGCIIFPN